MPKRANNCSKSELLTLKLKLPQINIFPLLGSVDFWRKMGYTQETHTTRVLSKNVVVGHELARQDNGLKTADVRKARTVNTAARCRKTPTIMEEVPPLLTCEV